jgi:hypothetical protein
LICVLVIERLAVKSKSSKLGAQGELRCLDAALGFALSSEVVLRLQHRIEEVDAAPLLARGLGREPIESLDHAEELHLGHQVTGNRDTHSFNFSCGWAGFSRGGGAVAEVTKQRVAGQAHDLARGLCGSWLVMTGLSQQHLEVRHPDLVEMPHVRDRRLQRPAGAIAAVGLQLFRRRTDQSLHATDVAVDLGVEQIHDQAMQLRVDEARLGEQLLRSGLVIRLGGWREVRIDLDPPTVAVTAARMNG